MSHDATPCSGRADGGYLARCWDRWSWRGAGCRRIGPVADDRRPAGRPLQGSTTRGRHAHGALAHRRNRPKLGPRPAATNSDMAFQGNYAFVGGFNGFQIFDISNPAARR